MTLRNHTMRNLITKIELAMFESALNPTDPAEDYAAKKKALYDLETNPNVMQEPDLMKAVAQRKADLEKEAHKHGVKETSVLEKAPEGWEGTVKAMKKHKDIDNPYALANYMKNKGYKSHKKEDIEEAGWRGGPKGYDDDGNPLGGGYDEYQGDPYGHKEAERNRQRREMEDSGTWYVRINGKVFRDKATGQPAKFTGKKHANSVAAKLASKDWNKGAKIVLSTSPDDKPEEFKPKGQI